MDPRKRSRIVLLSLVGLPLGAIGIATLLPAKQEMKCNLYPDRASCERDYSSDRCEQSSHSSGTTSSGTTSSHSSGFHGPYYFASRTAAGAASDPGPGRTGQVTATQTSMRGGFGSIGHASAASSSS